MTQSSTKYLMVVQFIGEILTILDVRQMAQVISLAGVVAETEPHSISARRTLILLLLG